jgi:signal peptidase I
MQPNQRPFQPRSDDVRPAYGPQPPRPTPPGQPVPSAFPSSPVPPRPVGPPQPAAQSYQPPSPVQNAAPVQAAPARYPDVTVNRAGSELPRGEGIKSILSTIAILLIAPILALGITAFLFQSYEVDGPSMESTLQTHDRLIIWKAPKTLARITRKDYQPQRGDVVVFIKKGLYDFDADKEKQLIKRVIGLPGERVVVKDNVMTVYNKEKPDGFQPDKTLAYGKVIGDTPGSVDVVVPENEVFVAGDNRVNSLDSRIFGTVPEHDIVGKMVARILPVKNAQKF